MLQKHKIGAVILAGGMGKRFDGSLKQFIRVGGKSLFVYSLNTFLSCTFVDSIVVVVPRNKVVHTQRTVARTYGPTADIRKIIVLSGGATRKQSSYRALKYFLDKEVEYVIFHDAARPLLVPLMIKAVVRAAIRYGAAQLGTSLVDTLYRVKGDFMIAVLRPKKRWFRGETPQCYQFEMIWRAHQKARNIADADNSALLLKMGKHPHIILNRFYPNLKVTFKQDIKMIHPFLAV